MEILAMHYCNDTQYILADSLKFTPWSLCFQVQTTSSLHVDHYILHVDHYMQHR